MSKKHKGKKQNPTENEAPKPDRSPKVAQRDKIDWQLPIQVRNELTPKQKEALELILDKGTKMVFLSGPAGTTKTYIAVLAALILLDRHTVSDILYVRSVVESASKSLGYLPGEEGDKMEPYLRPLRDKLLEFLPKGDVARLEKEERIEGVPVNYLRGASFNAIFAITDEAQNLDAKELTTVITRIGQYSKFVIVGDPAQSDINGRSGFIKMYDLFNDESSRKEGIHCFSFTKDDVLRSGVLRYIIERLETGQAILRQH